MTINFYEGKDDKPHRLFVQGDRVTVHDRIVLSEAFVAYDEEAVSFYGILSSESIGIENFKNKAWTPDGQKVLITFFKNKRNSWNNDSKKFEDKQVEPSENYLYTFAKNVLTKIQGSCVSVVVSPYVNPQFLEDMKTPQPDETLAYWEGKVKNTIIAVAKEQSGLSDTDAQIAKDVLSTSGYGSGKKAYQKLETEADKLEARWEFLRFHLSSAYPINSLYELGVLVSSVPVSPEAKEEQQTLGCTLDLIARMWA